MNWLSFRNFLRVDKYFQRAGVQKETKNRDELSSKHDDNHRIAGFRSQARNSSIVKSQFNQLMLHSIGVNFKPMFIAGETDQYKDFADQASAYIRRRSRAWEGRDNKKRINSQLLVFKTILIEGEVLAFFDQDGFLRQGRWFYFSADRMPQINEADFKAQQDRIRRMLGLNKLPKGRAKNITLSQNKGIIQDQYGITWGYVTASKPRTSARFYGDGRQKDECFIIPAFRFRRVSGSWLQEDNSVTLYKYDQELNAKHGDSQLTAIADDIDVVEKLPRFLMKRLKDLLRIIYLLKSNKKSIRAGAQLNRAAAKDALTNAEKQEELRNMENIVKENDDSYYQYLDKDEEVQTVSTGGDAPNVDNLYTMKKIDVGHSLGMFGIFATGSAKGNTFAGLQGEMNLSKATFEAFRKWFEREVLDFEFYHELKFAIAKGFIMATAPQELETCYRIAGYPRIKSLNTLQEINAKQKELGSGLLTLSDEHGDDWKKKIDQAAEEKAYAESLGLNLEHFRQGKAVEIEESKQENE